MSHEFENGLFVEKAAWHGLGKVFDENTRFTVGEAIKEAGLDWNVSKRPLVLQEDPRVTVPAWATMRDSDNTVLGVVGPTYKPLQNADAFAWFQPWLATDQAFIEAAGSLKHGRKVWVLARINRDPIEIVPGDDLRRYVLLSNGHDGTLSIRAGFTSVRVVCANTMAEAHNNQASKLIRIRHSEKSGKALAQIREIMKLADDEFVADAVVYRALARKGVNATDLKAYVRKVFAPTVSVLDDSETDSRSEKLIEKIVPLFEAGKGNDIPGVRGTAWAMYNSVSEYLTWERGRSQDNRMDSLWFGQGAQINQRALQMAVSMIA
jgi:phage/plasmid-like protein (TIGR03299 family)